MARVKSHKTIRTAADREQEVLQTCPSPKPVQENCWRRTRRSLLERINGRLSCNLHAARQWIIRCCADEIILIFDRKMWRGRWDSNYSPDIPFRSGVGVRKSSQDGNCRSRDERTIACRGEDVSDARVRECSDDCRCHRMQWGWLRLELFVQDIRYVLPPTCAPVPPSPPLAHFRQCRLSLLREIIIGMRRTVWSVSCAQCSPISAMPFGN